MSNGGRKQLIATLPNMNGKSWYDINTKGVVGNKVMIQIPGARKILSLAEVEVWGKVGSHGKAMILNYTKLMMGCAIEKYLGSMYLRYILMFCSSQVEKMTISTFQRLANLRSKYLQDILLSGTPQV